MAHDTGDYIISVRNRSIIMTRTDNNECRIRFHLYSSQPSMHHRHHEHETDIQTTSLARELRVQFDELMAYLLEAEDVVGSAGFWRMSSFNCTLPIPYFMRFLVYALVPIAAIVLPVIFQVTVYRYHKRRSASTSKSTPDRSLREYVSASAYTVFTLLVLSYTPVVRQVRCILDFVDFPPCRHRIHHH